MKYHADDDKRKLKFHPVHHGNRDLGKHSIGLDPLTAQFLCITVLFSLETRLKFFLSSGDISAAYLQSGELMRDVYMHPLTAWT